MGMVFPTATLKNGMFPKDNSHKKAIGYLRRKFKGKYEFVFAALFDTAALGRFTVRSSIQIVVIVHDNHEDEGMALLAKMTRHVFKTYFVRLQMKVFTHSEWRGGCINFGYTHVERLRACVENKEPLCGTAEVLEGFLLPAGRDSEAFFYATETIMSLRKEGMFHGIMSEAKECALLQLSLEAPIRAVRHYLAESGRLSDAWSKKDLALILKKENFSLGILFECCIENINRYGELVTSVVEGRMTPEVYAKKLNKEYNHTAVTLSLLEGIAWRLLRTPLELKAEENRRKAA